MEATPAGAALSRARVLYDLNKYDLAVRFALDAIAVAPNDVSAHVVLANSYDRLHKLREAEAAARRAIELDPARVSAHVALGMAWLSGRRYREALVAFREAVRIDPEYADAYRLIAHTQMNQQQYTAALASVRQALAIDPNSIPAREIQAIVLRRLWRTREAESATADVLRLRPESVLGLRQLAHLRMRHGRHRAALETFREALRLDPQSPTARRDYEFAILPFGISRFGPLVLAFASAIAIVVALAHAPDTRGPDAATVAFTWLAFLAGISGRALVTESHRRDPIGRSLIAPEALALNRPSLYALGVSAVATCAYVAVRVPAEMLVATGALFAFFALRRAGAVASTRTQRRVYRACAPAIVVAAPALAAVVLTTRSREFTTYEGVTLVVVGYLLIALVARLSRFFDRRRP